MKNPGHVKAYSLQISKGKSVFAAYESPCREHNSQSLTPLYTYFLNISRVLSKDIIPATHKIRVAWRPTSFRFRRGKALIGLGIALLRACELILLRISFTAAITFLCFVWFTRVYESHYWRMHSLLDFIYSSLTLQCVSCVIHVCNIYGE